MAVPPLRQIIEPLLRVLVSAADGLSARDAQDLVADRLGLSPEDRAIKVASGAQLLFRHRTNWAHDRLKRAGLSFTPRKGFWQPTRAGIEFVDSRMSTDSIRELAKTARNGRLPNSDTRLGFVVDGT